MILNFWVIKCVTIPLSQVLVFKNPFLSLNIINVITYLMPVIVIKNTLGSDLSHLVFTH